MIACKLMLRKLYVADLIMRQTDTEGPTDESAAFLTESFEINMVL